MVRIVILALALMLSGCANLNSIYRANVPLSRNRPAIISMDAKHRNVFMVPDFSEGSMNRAGQPVSTQWRLCAEAAPDVFSALSTSASGDLALTGKTGEREARARAALALTEAAGTIERTQTVNLLRESLYRTCERYLSGAISNAAFIVQSGRDLRAMIAILSIEQLTRTARPPAIILAGGKASTTIDGSKEAAEKLIAAQKAFDDAEKAVKTSNDKKPKDCDPAATGAAEACVTWNTTHNAAEEALAGAKTKRDEWQKAADAAKAASIGSTTEPITINTGQGGGAPEKEALKDVAATVWAIANKAFDTDETQLFCIQHLTDEAEGFGALQAQERRLADESSRDPRAATKNEKALTEVRDRLISRSAIADRCSDYLIKKVEAESRRLGVADEPQVVRDAAVRGRDIGHATVGIAHAMHTARARDYAPLVKRLQAIYPRFCVNLTQSQCVTAVTRGDYDMASTQLIAALTPKETGK